MIAIEVLIESLQTLTRIARQICGCVVVRGGVLMARSLRPSTCTPSHREKKRRKSIGFAVRYFVFLNLSPRSTEMNSQPNIISFGFRSAMNRFRRPLAVRWYLPPIIFP